MCRFRSPARWIAAGAMILALAACSKRADTDRRRPAVSERGRDSAIAKSRLPGAGTVGKALEVSDSASVRSARIDSLLR